MKRRQGDAPILIADPSNAYKILDWKPRLSNIKTIIRDAWQWHLKNNR